LAASRAAAAGARSGGLSEVLAGPGQHSKRDTGNGKLGVGQRGQVSPSDMAAWVRQAVVELDRAAVQANQGVHPCLQGEARGKGL